MSGERVKNSYSDILPGIVVYTIGEGFSIQGTPMTAQEVISEDWVIEEGLEEVTITKEQAKLALKLWKRGESIEACNKVFFQTLGFKE